MSRTSLLRWTCDMGCGTSVETPSNAERPKTWETVRLPVTVQRKRGKPKVQMKRLLACPNCIKELTIVADNWSGLVGNVGEIVEERRVA